MVRKMWNGASFDIQMHKKEKGLGYVVSAELHWKEALIYQDLL